MKDDSFDEEIAELYQKRKAQIVAPSITFNKKLKTKSYSMSKLLSILFASGITSFGIFALISHLATEPVKTGDVISTIQPVELVKVIPEKIEPTANIVKAKMPPKPIVKKPSINKKTVAITQQRLAAGRIETMDAPEIQVVRLPQLTEPRLAIKPVFKVMPKYPIQAQHLKQSGVVRFRYEITPSGTVENINVVNSDVSRDLEKSAKRALSKWRYDANDTFVDSYEIIFEFSRKN